MKYTEEVFKRATIRGIVDYLLFAHEEGDGWDYEARMEESYRQFEKAVLEKCGGKDSCLLDLVNALTSDTAGTYMELGLRVGILLCSDLRRGILYGKGLGKEPGEAGTSVLQDLYEARSYKKVDEALKNDRKYQESEKEVLEKLRELGKFGSGQEVMDIIDDALSAANIKSFEYGKVAYQQGFLDAMNLL